MRSAAYTSRVLGARLLSPEVRELTLEHPGGDFCYRAGQWISLHLPIGEKPPLVRAYTLASASREALHLCLDRYPDGLGSEYLFHLPVGERLQFDGPLGRFTMPESGLPLLWIARYTGIVPFRAMLQERRTSDRQAPVTLLYAADREEDLIYLDEFRERAVEDPTLRIETSLGSGPESLTPRLPELLAQQSGAVPMVCGAGSFVRAIRDWFVERGYERRAIRCESYD